MTSPSKHVPLEERSKPCPKCRGKAFFARYCGAYVCPHDDLAESANGTRWSWVCRHCNALGRSTASRQQAIDRYQAHSRKCAVQLAKLNALIEAYRAQEAR